VCVNLLAEKLKLVTVLIHQLLTTTVARNWIDDCAKRLVSAQRKLKCHQMAEQRRSRDETQFWWVNIFGLSVPIDPLKHSDARWLHSAIQV